MVAFTVTIRAKYQCTRRKHVELDNDYERHGRHSTVAVATVPVGTASAAIEITVASASPATAAAASATVTAETATESGVTSSLVNTINGRKELEQTLVLTNSKGGVTPLQRAAAEGHLEVVELLLKHGADVARQDTLTEGGATSKNFLRIDLLMINPRDW
ncbi:ankyrin repeat domain-containing protein 6 [Vespula maculifrons]|uniref:Ankyrin repeat domain-containing protein 6 n=1 Tax=Vespula maculifrons TaxID=7453 RepID=A0ABD2BKP6_VESMC